MSRDRAGRDFEKAAASEAEESLLTELWGFLRANKKWWLLPILAVLLLMGVLFVLGSSAAAPFIYTLF
jgi:hypothetical protein